jgi:hypothetical protein
MTYEHEGEVEESKLHLYCRWIDDSAGKREILAGKYKSASRFRLPVLAEPE